MEHIEKTAKDYKNYLETDINSLATPLNASIEEMLTRLKDIETTMTSLAQDQQDFTDILTSIPNYRGEFDNLCDKIDTFEKLIGHMKSNLNDLENEMDKAETNLGCAEKTSKVTQIFTPLFKKTLDKKEPNQQLEIFKTEDYFE
ncbi:unnamed protein product [Phyllotreta striolata]|uniref:Biogenesis of lysosome-related organelles complex 1 subunit 4 n=1 Tax=Phyllotreta striolata TaxID=444603 RepID=A0A9N9TSX8_PHYSR|nr:unnamed protein product [Phyllotreta striolata]